MRHPLMTACASLALSTCTHAPVVRATDALHVFSVNALPAGVQALLREQRGDIADSHTRVDNGCLVEPGIVGQRLAAAEMTPQQVQVDIQHGRVHALTRVKFTLKDGAWTHAGTTTVPRPALQGGAFAAAFKGTRDSQRWAPLPTDGSVAFTLPQQAGGR